MCMRYSNQNKIKFIFITLILSVSFSIYSNPANFKVTLDYKSNKKIWGTYNLNNEQIQISRGKKKWNKHKKKQLGDLIIKDGHLHFFKAIRDKEGMTKILIEKIPYKKESKNFKSNKKLKKQQFDTIFAQGINELIPHKDLIDGKVTYSHVSCKRKPKGLLRCTITGKLLAKQKIATSLK